MSTTTRKTPATLETPFARAERFNRESPRGTPVRWWFDTWERSHQSKICGSATVRNGIPVAFVERWILPVSLDHIEVLR